MVDGAGELQGPPADRGRGGPSPFGKAANLLSPVTSMRLMTRFLL